MYQTSHSQMSYSGGSGLESMARSYSSGITYSASAIPTWHGYSSSIRFNSTISNSGFFQYSHLTAKTNYLQTQKEYMFTPQNEYLFSPDNFLKPGTGTRFIGKAEEIREFVEETFVKIFNKPFPDIKVSVLNTREFRKLAPNPGTVGMSINRPGSLSEIFVLQDTLGKVMLTVGHELGHVLTNTLKNPINEEAKAYAFSLVWMQVISDNNIAGLGNAIVTELPAENGLHNVAYKFVKKCVEKGKSFWNLYSEIISQVLSVAA